MEFLNSKELITAPQLSPSLATSSIKDEIIFLAIAVRDAFLNNFTEEKYIDIKATRSGDIVMQCYRQLLNAYFEFEATDFSTESFEKWRDHLLTGINIFISTVRNPSGAYFHDS